MDFVGDASKTFKHIDSVTASPAQIKLPRKTTSLKVVATDPANGSNLYTWKKLEGPGVAVFKPYGNTEAAICKVALSTEGKYVLEVTLSDPRCLSEISKTITITVGN